MTIQTTNNAYAVLSLREIRNLLAIAEKEAALRTKYFPELAAVKDENFCVCVLGAVNVDDDGKPQVRLESAGYYGGQRNLWNNEPAS